MQHSRSGWAFAGYALLTLALTYPLVTVVGVALPHDPGDPVLNAWILWWNSRAVPLTSAWWNAPAFYPAPDVLAFSEHLLGLAFLSAPVQWVTGNPILAYNLVFLLSFPFSGWAMYLLGFELTRRRDAAWVAGLAYAFAPYRVEQIAHVQVLSSYWMPLALLCLHAYLRDPRRTWLVLLGGAVALQGLTNGYFLLFFPILIGLWVLWFASPLRPWSIAAHIGAACTAALAAVAPFLLRYRAAHDAYGFARPLDEISGFSADVTSVFSAPVELHLWRFLRLSSRAEGHLFPGVTMLLLLGMALVTARWRPSGPSSWSLTQFRRVLVVLAVVIGAVLAARLWLGPFAFTVLGIAVSVTRWDKPLSLLLLFLLTAALLSPPIVEARQRRSVLGFYLLGAAVTWVLALGPTLTLLNQPILYRAPYSWLMTLPGFDALRVPARFWMLTLVCLSTCAGLAYARLVPANRRWGPALLAGVTAAGLADCWIAPMLIAPAPARSAVLERAARHPVIELPIRSRDADLAAMYRSMFHGQPVANGYSGYLAPHYPALQSAAANLDPLLLTSLASVGVRDVRIDRATDVEGMYAQYVARHPGAELIAEDEDELLFRLPPAPPPREALATGPELSIAHLDANVKPDRVDFMLDGDRWTRWDTGPQRKGHELRIDLGTEQAVEAVSTALGPYFHDFPRVLSVEVSRDGEDWLEVWRGPTATLAMTSALRAPADLPLVFPIGGRRARFLRLRQLGEDPDFYWSIAELKVLGPRLAEAAAGRGLVGDVTP